ncbi:MAG: ASCH domain-containing protein [Alphaproteobacteria bacterium]|nr:ASCH domain-containing protein [Alphaproteobacteria bacterium]
MPAFGYKQRFVRPIAQGVKRQTIRPERKDGRPPCKPGDRLAHWEGWRTRAARRIATGRCTLCAPITIDRPDQHGDGPCVTIRDRVLSPHEIEKLACDDAFRSTEDFVAFFEDMHGLPFAGWIIKWEPTRHEGAP